MASKKSTPGGATYGTTGQVDAPCAIAVEVQVSVAILHVLSQN